MSFMAKTTRRKLFLFGKYSLALLPPKKWLSKIGVKVGDEVEIELDSTKRRLIVRFDPKLLPEGKKTKKTLSQKTNPDDWEPIA
ncbi:MAG: AbrB/MazE/SpoVT family DNA-binding domain-containing protein, partial [Patescibacteria group bacterium]